MEITNANVLMTQINAGANLVVSGGQLKTQDSFGKLLQNIGDIFRSNASIAARNDNLSLAMANMLHGGQGPQNLAALPTTTPEGRQIMIQNAKMTIISNLINHGIDSTYSDKAPELRTAMKEYCTQIIGGDADRAFIAGSKNTGSLRDIADHALRIFDTQLNSPTDQKLQTNLEKFDPMRRTPAEAAGLMTSLQNLLTLNCSEDRSKLNSLGQRNFDADGFYDIAALDFPRDHPSINGQIIPDKVVGKQVLLNFCENKDEMEVLSLLMTQTSLAPVIDILNNPQYGISSGMDTLFSSLEAVQGTPRFSLTRMDNGDARLEVTSARTINGMFNGDAISQRQIGKMFYEIIVPHEQFATPLLPSQTHDIRVQNMRLTGVND